jgi:hypothetical protein
MATISFRKNYITGLLNDQGVWFYDHDGKAGMIWNSFRGRMGIATAPIMSFELESLFTPSTDLKDLVLPFQHVEI